MNSQQQNYDFILRIKLDGSANVGKTSILYRYVDQVFPYNLNCTIGLDFKVKNIEKYDKKIKLQIWDVSGSERYRCLTPVTVKDMKGLILVYDITDMNSFQNIKDYFNAYKKLSNTVDVIYFLIGNKCDLETQRKVSISEGQQLADSLGMKFFEVSAQSSQNVDMCFEEMLSQIFQRK